MNPVPGTVLNALCAGATQGLVERIAEEFQRTTGARVQSRFGPVGAMREALLAGEPCDVMIVSQPMMNELARSGEIGETTLASLGGVGTGIAVPASDQLPDISSPESLRSTMLASAGVYLPDPVRATAGIHLVEVLKQLDVYDICASRLRTFPSGASGMRELAQANGASLIGCAQTTEILHTAGVRLAGGLPEPFQLSTVYTAGVSRRARNGELSARLVELLSASRSSGLRLEAGFDPI